ncbi:MAG TPA: hypothetical protein PLM41_14775 [Saprospiraceae bacterium]|nr:hypothetical protein [Saprospiraceae bacterium]
MNVTLPIRKRLVWLSIISAFCIPVNAATIESALTGNWENVSTWVGGVVPAPTDDVVIKPTHTVTLNSAQDCGNLTIQGILTVNAGGNLSQSGPTDISGTLTILNGGLLNFTQVYTLGGICNISGTKSIDGGFSGSGTLNLLGGSVVTFNTGSVLSSNLNMSSCTIVDNSGLAPATVSIANATYSGTGSPVFAGLAWNGGSTFSGSGTITVTGNITGNAGIRTIAGSKELRVAGTSNLLNGATIDLAGTATIIVPNGGVFGGAYGNIDGTSANSIEVKTGGTFALSSGSSNVSCNFFLNGGTLTVGGTLRILGIGTTHTLTNGIANITGALNLGPGTAGTVTSTSSGFSGNGILTMASGTVYFNNSNSISVTGGFNVSGGNTTLECSVTGAPPVTLTGGNLIDNIGPGFGAVSITNATYSGTGSPVFAALAWNGGSTFSGSGTITVTGNITGNAGIRTIAGSKELRVAGTSNLLNGATIDLAGTATIIVPNGGVFGGAYGNIDGTSANSIEVKTGGTFALSSGSSNVSCNFFLNGGTLTVGGTLRILGIGTTHTLTNGIANITGALNLGPGTAGTVTSTSSGFSGNGILTIVSGTVYFNNSNSIALTGGFNVSGGNTTLECPVTGAPSVTLTGGNLIDNIGPGFGTVSITNATYSGTGSPVFAGLAWNGGSTFSGSGTVTVTGNITGAAGIRTIAGSKELRVAGTSNLLNGATITLSGTAKITVLNGGVFGGAYGSINDSGAGILEIQPGGAMNYTGTTSNIGVLFTNNGAVSVNTGILNITQATTHSGNFFVGTGATLGFTNSSSNTTLTGTAVTNNGSITVPANRTLIFGGTSLQTLAGNGTIFSNLTLNNPAGLIISGSQVIPTFNFTDGMVQMTGGDVNITTLNGAGNTRFFETLSNGRLVMPVSGTAKTFPVGPGGGAYNPANLQQVSGNTAFGVRVAPALANAPANDGYVDRTWQIDLVTGTANTHVTLFWSPEEETVDFDAQDCSVARYDGSAWQGFTLGAAACPDMCSRTATGITLFSPFSVLSRVSLPVELLHFSGLEQSNGNVLLNWSTASEYQNKGFSIEKSSNGTSFIPVGFVAGNGNSQEEHAYAFEDKNFHSDAYYRLNQQDLDGTSSISSIIFVKKATPETGINFANPVSGHTLLINDVEPSAKLEIAFYDITGRQVAVFQNPDISAGQLRLDISRLPAGSYVFHMIQDSKIQVLKLQILR